MSWWATLKSKFGPGSRIDRIRSALPTFREARQRLEAWKATVLLAGAQLERWEPEDSKLLDFARDCADMLDVVGKLAPLPGAEKMQILIAAVRGSVTAVEWADDRFDAWWARANPVIEEYLARRPRPAP